MDEKEKKGRKETGIRASFHRNKITLWMNLEIDREKAFTFLILLLILFLVLASTLGEETRKLLLSLLLSAIKQSILISSK